jgi:hypothetical protein
LAVWTVDCAELRSSEQDAVKKARADALFSDDSDIKEFSSHISGRVFFLKLRRRERE